jgi:4,5-dihydroxyphthalate decarboxylase
VLNLTIGFSRTSPRVRPLIEGTVKPQGIKLRFVLHSSPAELFVRNLRYDEFDVFEMYVNGMAMAKERADEGKWQWSGLPIFPVKAFIQFRNLFVRNDANIHDLGDLRGKRVGVPDYTMSTALWLREFLNELYGVKPEEIDWYNGRIKQFSHAALFGLDKNPPRGVSLRWLTEDQTFDAMLNRGDLDAAFGYFAAPDPRLPSFAPIDRYGGTPLVGNPRIRELFPDGGRKIAIEYYKKKGVIPVTHMVALQTRILENHPWVALELYKAFEMAKEVAYEQARRWGSAYLLFEGEERKNQIAMFGEDPHALGVKANRKMLETLFRSSYEQGLTRKVTQIEDIFYSSTLDT